MIRTVFPGLLAPSRTARTSFVLLSAVPRGIADRLHYVSDGHVSAIAPEDPRQSPGLPSPSRTARTSHALSSALEAFNIFENQEQSNVQVSSRI